MSGYTAESQQGEYYRPTLTTPNVSFAMNPKTGGTSEQEYHARARKTFVAMLERTKPAIDRAVATLRAALADGPTLVRYEESHPTAKQGSGPLRLSLLTDFPSAGSLELCVDQAPTSECVDEIRARVRTLLAASEMAPRHTGKYFRFVLPNILDLSVDPSTGELGIPELAEAVPRIERHMPRVVAKLGERLGLLPFDGYYPLISDYAYRATPPRRPDGQGAVRLELSRLSTLGGGCLELCFAKAPSVEDRLELMRRLEELLTEKPWCRKIFGG